MKKVVWILIIVMLLGGCADTQAQLDRAMTVRAAMIAEPVSFDAKVTADYGDKSYTFSMKCTCDTDGNLKFEVIEPKSIQGISGIICGTGGKLTFDDTALAFELMADGQFSPVSAPWVLMKTLRGGYLTSCTQEGDYLRVAIDDSYEEDALHLDIWMNGDDKPKVAEIFWKGRRLLTVEVENFIIG